MDLTDVLKLQEIEIDQEYELLPSSVASQGC
jgi:hypothetical protein